VIMSSRCDMALERHNGLRNDKEDLNFEFFCRSLSINSILFLRLNSISQIRINAYTFILKKDFQICRKENSNYYIKIKRLIGKTDVFRILLTTVRACVRACVCVCVFRSVLYHNLYSFFYLFI